MAVEMLTTPGCQQVVVGNDGSLRTNGDEGHGGGEADIANEPTMLLPAACRNQLTALPIGPSAASSVGKPTGHPRVQIDHVGNVAVNGSATMQPSVESHQGLLPNLVHSRALPAADSAKYVRDTVSHSNSSCGLVRCQYTGWLWDCRPRVPNPAHEPTRRMIEDENVIVVRSISYTKLECVGRGGSSKVYKVMAPNRKIFALKRIRLNGRDTEAANGFLDEITLLNKLRGKANIIQLVDAEVSQSRCMTMIVISTSALQIHNHAGAPWRGHHLHGSGVWRY
jgi:Protein kinase domain